MFTAYLQTVSVDTYSQTNLLVNMRKQLCKVREAYNFWTTSLFQLQVFQTMDIHTVLSSQLSYSKPTSQHGRTEYGRTQYMRSKDGRGQDGRTQDTRSQDGRTQDGRSHHIRTQRTRSEDA